MIEKPEDINKVAKVGSGINFSFDLSDLTSVGKWASDAIFGTNLMGNDMNAEIARENMKLLDQMNKENIAFQKSENDITRAREDDAIRRAAYDMEQAGLSKTLAAGNPASAQALTAPHTEAVQNTHKVDMAIGKMNLAQRMQDLYFQNESNDRANALNDAQIQKLQAETMGQNIDNGNKMSVFESEQAVRQATVESLRSSTAYNNALTKIQQIIGDYKAEQCQMELNKMASDIAESESRKLLNYSYRMKTIEEMTTELLKQEGLRLDNEKSRNQLEIQIKEMAKMELENQILTHNLGYAQEHNLPVGSQVGGILGQIFNLGDYMGNATNSFVPDYYFDFIKPKSHIPSDHKGASGGHAW